MLNISKKIPRAIRTLILFFALLFVALSSFAETSQPSPYVNILVWRGYLDDPNIRTAVKKECNANISYDEFYSNNEFLSRFEHGHNNYDIIIFPFSIYSLIKDEIKLPSSDLWQQSLQYNPTIRAEYQKNKFSPNVVFLEHSIIAFLYNPEVINLLPSDDLATIFAKAKTNILVVTDDPVEVESLVQYGTSQKNDPIDMQNAINYFRKITQNNKLYLTNYYNKIATQPNFAFAYSWASEAIHTLTYTNKNYKLLIHPKLSFISTDLLAELNNKTNTNCVAKVLSSKEVTTLIQNRRFYFSPYTDSSNLKNTLHQDIYKEFLKNLNNLQWIEPQDANTVSKLNRMWELIKIETYSNASNHANN
jgi:hypothetical protein